MRIVIVLLHVMTIALYVLAVVEFYSTIQDDGETHEANHICQGEEVYDSLLENKIIVWAWSVASILIDIWLVIINSITICVLNQLLHFSSQKVQINVIMTSFVISYVF